MTLVVTVPNLPKEGDFTPTFNPNVRNIEHGTLVFEFNVAMKTFCVITKRLFPEVSIARIYTDNLQSISNRLDALPEGKTQMEFYAEHARGILGHLLAKIFQALEKKDSRMKKATGGDIIRLFSIGGAVNESILSLLNKPSSPAGARSSYERSKAAVGEAFDRFSSSIDPSQRNFHGALQTLYFGAAVLHQVENRLLAVFTSRMAKYGPMVEYDDIDFPELLSTVSFAKRDLPDYLNQLNKMVFGGIQEALYMRLLFSDIQYPSRQPSIMISGLKFPRPPFESRGIFVNELGRPQGEPLRFSVSGCLDVDSKCGIDVEFAPFNVNEAYVTMAASRLGFSPALTAAVLAVGNEPTDSKVSGLVGARQWMIFSTDRMEMTLKEAFAQNIVTEQDARDILVLLTKYEEAHFVNHDISINRIKVKIDRQGARRWYLTNHSKAWYGGTNFSNTGIAVSAGSAGSAAKGGAGAGAGTSGTGFVRSTGEAGARANFDIPYGFDRTTNTVVRLNPSYAGWMRLLFLRVPPRFDASALLISIVGHHSEASFETKKMFVSVFEPYVRGHIVVRGSPGSWHVEYVSPGEDDVVGVTLHDEREARLFPLKPKAAPSRRRTPKK